MRGSESGPEESIHCGEASLFREKERDAWKRARPGKKHAAQKSSR